MRAVVATMLALVALPAAAVIIDVEHGKTDCYAGVDVMGGMVQCHDGDPTCDADGTPDGRCTFEMRVCVHVRGIRRCTLRRIERVDVSDVRCSGCVPDIPLPAVPASHQRCGDVA